MNLKKLMLSVNSKLENKFDSLSKISASVLIFGQFFLLMILTADLLYAIHISSDPRVFPAILGSVRLLFENAAAGLFLLWITAIFIDYIEKKNNPE